MPRENNTPYWGSVKDNTRPFSKLVEITPNDLADIAETPRALFINVGGSLNVIAADNEDSEACNLVVTNAFILPGRIRRVLATGTTASGIFGLY